MATVFATHLNSTSRDLELSNVHPMDSSQLFMMLLNLVHDSDPVPGTAAPHLIAAPILRKLLSALHFRDANTLKHSRRVGLISVGIASRLGWEEADLRIIEIASLMHDIGKIGIPDHILRKPGKLGPDEAEYIAVYHRVALTLLQACQVHPDITEIIAQSHGVGEESRNHRNTLNLGARILAVADAYDSLTTQQCFRAPFDRWEALQILEEQSGKQFDRNVVSALGRWLDGADAARLADERAAEVSIHVNAPVDMATRLSATQFCHVFHHLYLLESLYDAVYVVDANRQVIIWNSCASHLFGRSTQNVIRNRWNRQLVSPTHMTTDPIELVFRTGQPICHSITIKRADGSLAEADAQTIPVHGPDQSVCGVVELICNNEQSKLHRGHFRSLKIAATRDALTGVLNRGELENQLKQIYDTWSDHPESPFSVIFMDLDHFKSINDKHSHAVGDRVLIDCARLLQDELYSGEYVGRYGGEEFVILCPETNASTAMERAERLRRILMSTTFPEAEGLKVTASFGVAEVDADDTISTVMGRADGALYEAKHKGRNCSCLAEVKHKPKRSEKGRRPRGKFSLTSTLTTFVAEDMLQIKLAGFVDSQSARILKVEPKHLELQVGQGGLLSGWSRPAVERIPVKMTIDVSDQLKGQENPRAPRLVLNVTIEPIGSVSNEEIFRERAQRLMEDLRSYLIGH